MGRQHHLRYRIFPGCPALLDSINIEKPIRTDLIAIFGELSCDTLCHFLLLPGYTRQVHQFRKKFLQSFSLPCPLNIVIFLRQPDIIQPI